jgi:acyl-ACP thioesterase
VAHPEPPHRTFPGRRRVRLGDVTATGRLRLDAMARYLQDVATDDAEDAGLADGWVLRRLGVRIDGFPRFRDTVDMVTWCSGVAASAAERRTTVAVGGQVLVDAVALWVFVGPDGRPARIDKDRFGAAGIPLDRRIGTRLHHDDGPAPDDPRARTRAWPLRAADVDVLAHVNNAATLAALEDVLYDSGSGLTPAPWSVEIEYRRPVEPTDDPVLVWEVGDGGVAGALRCAGRVCATFRLRPGDPAVDSRA